MILVDALLQECIIAINPETYPISPVSPLFKLSFLRLKAVRRFDIPISSPSCNFHLRKVKKKHFWENYCHLPNRDRMDCCLEKALCASKGVILLRMMQIKQLMVYIIYQEGQQTIL